MPLNIPTRSGVVQSLLNYVKGELPRLNITVPMVKKARGFVGGIIFGLGSAIRDWYVALKRYADNEPFPQTASESFLFGGWWVPLTRLQRNPATAATGKIAITGLAGSLVLEGTEFQSGGEYFALQDGVGVAAQTINAESLQRIGDTAIFTTGSDHYLATGMEVVVSGADQDDYNGTVEVNVTGAREFTYSVDGSAATPATGAPIAAIAMGVGTVTSTTKGQAANVDAGNTIAMVSPISGVDTSAFVTWGGIAGGADIEGVEAFRDRILEALANDRGMFNSAEIVQTAKTVPGVTRVFVKEAAINPPAGDPIEGQVRIAFLRDGDADPFPKPQAVEDVRSAILLIKPAHVATDDVDVRAPDADPIDFTFSSISPDTGTMRQAIENQLKQFFAEEPEYETALAEKEYLCAIKATVDPDTGAKLQDFTLTSPTGAISGGQNTFATLGSVEFS